MENKNAHSNDPGSRKRTCIGNGQALARVDQNVLRPHQYNSTSAYKSATSKRQICIPEQVDYTEQYEETQGKHQIQPRWVVNRIRALEHEVIHLQRQLYQAKKEKDYYKCKTMDFYKKLCMHEPAMLAKYQQKVLIAANLNTAPSPSASISSDTAPSVFRSPVPPSSDAVTSVPSPSALTSSAKTSAIPYQFSPSPLAVPSVTHLSAPLLSAAVPSATYQAAAPTPASSHCMPNSTSSVAASALYIDLTLEKTPLVSPTSQKRKWAPEQESQVGDQLRKKILTKAFQWMEPKDRPNFKKRNPYKPEPNSFESPLEIDPTETSKGYPTDSLQYDYNLGQASQEPPFVPSQAPAHPLASAKLQNPQKNKLSKHEKRKPNNKKPQLTTRAQRQGEARERIITKRKQIIQEQNATTVDKSQEQEAENFETTGAELEAMLEEDIEDLFGQEESN